MPELRTEVSPQVVEQESILVKLPFTYVRTEDPSAAEYREWRSPARILGTDRKLYTDEQIVEKVRQKKESEQWYTLEYWRKKGEPQEQVEFIIDEQQVTIYNFNSEKVLCDEHLEKAQSAFQEMASRFPQVMNKIRWILVDNEQIPSLLGDSEKYPINGMAYINWNAFKFYPRGIELFPYRLSAVSNFEGVFCHELTHLIQSEFESEWTEKFKWRQCQHYEDEWELRPTPDGTMDTVNLLCVKTDKRDRFDLGWRRWC